MLPLKVASKATERVIEVGALTNFVSDPGDCFEQDSTVETHRRLFYYGCATLALGAAAHVAGTVFGWIFPTKLLLAGLVVNGTVLRVNRDLARYEEAPLFTPGPVAVQAVRLLLLALLAQTVFYFKQEERLPSDWAFQAFLLSVCMLSSATIAALPGFGLTATFGRWIATALLMLYRVEQALLDACFEFARRRARDRYRKKRREARRQKHEYEAEFGRRQ